MLAAPAWCFCQCPARTWWYGAPMLAALRGLSAVTAAVGCAAFVAPTALPDSRSASPNAAVAMYVEQIPTASGPVASGNTGSKSTGLPPSVLNELRAEGGSYEAALIKLATSSPLETNRA